MLKLMCIQIKHTVNLINCLNLLDPTNIVVFVNAWIPREKYDPMCAHLPGMRSVVGTQSTVDKKLQSKFIFIFLGNTWQDI